MVISKVPAPRPVCATHHHERARRAVGLRGSVALLTAGAALTTLAGAAGCSGEVAAGPAPADASVDTTTETDANAPLADGGVDARTDARTDTDAVADVEVPPGPDGAALTGSWLAFASNRLGNFDLYLVRPDGGELHSVVQGPGNQLFPAWSPDGKTLAFASDANGDYALFLVDAASGAVKPLVNDRARGTAPAFSPDGTMIAFGGDGPDGGLIYRVPVAGGTATPLTSGSARDSRPVWAPDGSVLYFATDRAGPFDVWSVKPDGTSLQRVTTGTNLLGGPAISPDGKVLAYSTAVKATGDAGASTQVVLYTLATKSVTVLSASHDSEPAFAPVGSLIGVTSQRFGASNSEIVLLDRADASAPLRITNNPAVDGEVTFRPSP